MSVRGICGWCCHLALFWALVLPLSARAELTSYELALKAFRGRDFKQAEQLLADAVGKDPQDHESRYLLGLVFLHERKLAEAETVFRGLLELDDPGFLSCAFELAYIYIEQGKPEEARRMIDLARPLNEARARYLTGLLERSMKAETEPKPKPRPWSLSASVGIQYDDNLYGDPLDRARTGAGPLSIDGEKDLGFLTLLRGSYDLWQASPWRIGVAYEHHSLTYLDQSANDLIGASPSVFVEWEGDTVLASLEYVYRHYWVANESRLHMHSVYPRVAVRHGERWMTELSGGFEGRLYQDATPDDRRYFVRLMELRLINSGRGHLRAGYQADVYDRVPRARADYVEHSGVAGFLYPVWGDRWFLDVEGKFTWRDYEFDPWFSALEERNDTEQDLTVNLYGNLTEHLVLSFIYERTWQDSDVNDATGIDPFHYGRNVFTWMLTYNW